LFLAGSIAIRVSMGKPVLFRQLRPGLREQPFSIYKFRTMTPAAPRETWFRTDQQRLTLLGRFLRKASIDELPELLNVLKGEMSLVGPRPLLTEYLQKYTPREQRRHDVRPGITGWAQVNGRQNIPFSRRLELDVWYADNWSIALDVKILVLTLARGLRMTGVVSGQDLNDVDDIGLSADRERLTDPAKRKK
jgi:lipopolysaccharide/colanic/teichoic acid biosynthesis glycosyltransferase